MLTPLAKSFLFPLGLLLGTSAVDKAIQKKILASSATARIFSNEEMEDIAKIVKSLEESGLQGISELNKNEAK